MDFILLANAGEAPAGLQQVQGAPAQAGPAQGVPAQGQQPGAGGAQQGQPAQPSPHQLNVARRFFADVPEAQKTEAAVAVAQTLAELSHQQVLDYLGFDAALKDIARYMPTPAGGNQLPAGTRAYIEETVRFYVPHERRQPVGQPPNNGNNNNQRVVVETAEDQRTKRLRIEVGTPTAIPFPRHPQEPWSALYPHLWITKIKEGMRGQDAYVEWERLMDRLLPLHSVRDYLLPRRQQLFLGIEAWLVFLPPAITVETAETLRIRSWMALIEQLLEMALVCNARSIGIARSSSDPVACAAFWSALAKAAASSGSAVIDYFAAMSSAGESKDPSTKDPLVFRRGGKPTGLL